MPLPVPNNKEEESHFVARCMESSVMQKDFKDQKQRLSVCYSQYKKAKKNAKGAEVSWDTFENDSILFLI